MLKKILLGIVIFTGLSAYAADNYLNSVVISKNDNETSIILRTDEKARLKKEIISQDKVVLTLKGVAQASNINTLYKNTSDVGGLVIQNEGNNDVSIYVEAPEISKASVVFETPNSAPVTAGVNKGKIVWTFVSFVLLLFVMIRRKKKVEEVPDINTLIKEREKALYKNFQREVSTLPSINYKLKSYRKHVLKGETIRSYESRMSKVS